MKEIDEMVAELKKIKKGFVIFYETPSETTPVKFLIIYLMLLILQKRINF